MVKEKVLRFDYLDGVRGVAALVVVFGHFKNAFFNAPANSSISSNFWGLFDLFFLTGGFSVQLFFVLSGFVLAYNSFNRPSFLKKQFFKRIFRLFVPVFITALIYWLFANNGWFYFKQLSLHHTNSWIAEHWVANFSFGTFLKQFFVNFILFMDWGFILNNNSSLWTIPIEFYWSYVLFAAFAIANYLKTKGWGTVLNNLVMASLVLFTMRFAPFQGVVYGLLFLFGALFAYNYKFIIGIGTKITKLLLALSILVLLCMVEIKALPNVDNTPFRWPYLVAALMILAALTIGRLQAFFSLPAILWLGRVSYALYLIHLLVLGSIGAKLFLSVPFFQNNVGLIALLLVLLIIIFVTAHFFTVYIDEPLMKFFDKVYTRIKSLFLGKNLTTPDIRSTTKITD